MATISSLGIGSGLDLNSMLTKLMSVEQQPLVVLAKKEAGFQAKISALGTLKSGLSALQTAAETLIPATGTTAADKYTTTKAAVSDTTLATATATNTAVAGSYTLSDIVLAKAQQVSKTGYTAPGEAGTLSITVGSGSAVSVDIASGATLAQVVEAINKSTAEVTASVINNGSGDLLVLTADKMGASNTITVAGANSDGSGTDFDFFDYSSGAANSWTQQQAAETASFKINGIAVTSDSNTVSTAIGGVTLNLVKAGGPATLSVSKDNNAVSSSLNAFIKTYNEVAKTAKDLGSYDAANKKASTLTGDATLRSVQTQLRSVLFEASGGSNADLQRLSDLGVSVQLDGTLKLDSTKLSAAISSDFANVATLVADIGTRFKAKVSSLVTSGGTVSSSIDGLNASVKSIGKRREALSLRLETVEKNYRRQFSALDSQLASLQSLSSRLQAQLASLPSASS